ncbi:kinase-like protein [Gigaspora margarita]|uniref:Kinase-like protein n=1 Tax=Gigaspora margarita TaxID=4874 RepID=A0A8H4AHD8_GIGMA|nr:kinase-like protein [Gigaspora margarita]
MSDHLNETIEKIITKERAKQYNLFKNIQEICRGPFGIVRKATWGDKTVVLKSLNNDTNEIYINAFINEHSKNILVHHQRMIIADFGISKHIDEVTMVKAGGMFAYLEPRCFADPKYKCDKRSDIYSFGVILWEISSGRPPFDSYEHKIAIVMQVNSGVREIPVKNTPDIYVDLYKRCWDQDPGKRPKIMEVLEDLKTIRFSKSMNSRSFIRSFKSLESIRPFKSIKLNKFTVSMDNLFRSPTHEGTSQSNEETSQSSEDAPQSNEVTSQSSEDASQSNEDTSEETSQSNEENANNTIGIRSLKLKLENKRFILSIKNIFPPSTDDAGKSSQLNNEIFQSKEVPFQSNAEPFQSNEEPFNPNEEPFQSNNEPFQLNGDTSTIITNEHIKEIISWINPSPHNTLHELKLILRGSRDGN